MSITLDEAAVDDDPAAADMGTAAGAIFGRSGIGGQPSSFRGVDRCPPPVWVTPNGRMPSKMTR